MNINIRLPFEAWALAAAARLTKRLWHSSPPRCAPQPSGWKASREFSRRRIGIADNEGL